MLVDLPPRLKGGVRGERTLSAMSGSSLGKDVI